MTLYVYVYETIEGQGVTVTWSCDFLAEEEERGGTSHLLWEDYSHCCWTSLWTVQ